MAIKGDSKLVEYKFKPKAKYYVEIAIQFNFKMIQRKLLIQIFDDAKIISK